VAEFVKRNPLFSELPLPELKDDDKKRLLKDFDDGKHTISFRVNGHLTFADSGLKSWWAGIVQRQRQEILGRLRSGEDAFLPGTGPLTDSSPTVFGNVPLASFDAAPFSSYGLGKQTVTFRLETAEKAAAALNALVNDSNSRLQLEQFGKKQLFAVFWAVHRTTGRQFPADFMQLLDQPDPLAVHDYLRGIWGARSPEIETADFHLAIVLKGTGRFSVRSWHTDTLANADKHVQRYFRAIALSDSQERSPTLRDLAWATIAKTKKQKTKPAPVTFNALFEAAWRGTPIPFDLLAATLERQRVELASGDVESGEFQARLGARTALVQLYFTLKNKSLTLTTGTIMNTKDTAILCGRLLALLDKIHDKAHDGKSASSPANRVYGAASATPALVFPRLCQLARYHLQKMDGGMARKLEFGVPKDRRADNVPEDFEGLAAVVARLKEASDGDFPRMLSVEDQGRFALGFYYERARQWPNFKDSKTQTGNS
jgi:CRISPR-associated protein Csd1